MRVAARVRAPAAGVVAALALLLLPVAVVGSWVDGTVTDTDRYVDAVGPLADDPDVQDAVAERLGTAVMTAIDRAGVVREAVAAVTSAPGVPPRASDLLEIALAGAREQLRAFVDRAAQRLVRTEDFAEAWRTANRSAHRQLMAVLEDESAFVESSGDSLRVDLATVVLALRGVLRDAGLRIVDRLPPIEASFPIADVEQLASVRGAVRTLEVGSRLLLVAALVLPLLAVSLARRRRRMVVTLLVLGVLALLAVLLAIAVGRDAVVTALPDPDRAEAAGAVVDIVTDRLRGTVRLLALVLLVVAALVGLTGPSRPARTVRRAAATVWSARSRSTTAPVLAAVGGGAALVATLLLLLTSAGPVTSATLLALVLLGGGAVAAAFRAERG